MDKAISQTARFLELTRYTVGWLFEGWSLRTNGRLIWGWIIQVDKFFQYWSRRTDGSSEDEAHKWITLLGVNLKTDEFVGRVSDSGNSWCSGLNRTNCQLPDLKLHHQLLETNGSTDSGAVSVCGGLSSEVGGSFGRWSLQTGESLGNESLNGWIFGWMKPINGWVLEGIMKLLNYMRVELID